MTASELIAVQFRPAPTTLEALGAKQHLEATSSLMAGLAGLLDGQPGNAVSLEFAAEAGSMSTIITTPADWQAEVTHLLYAAYPAGELTQLDHRDQPKARAITMAALEFTPAEASLREPDFTIADPLAGLFEVLSSVPTSETLIVRLILAGTATKPTLTARAVNGLGDLLLTSTRQLVLGTAGEPDAENKEEPEPKTKTAPLRANLIFIAAAGTETAAEALIRRAAGSYHAHALPGTSKARYQILPAKHQGRPGAGYSLDPGTAFLLTSTEAAGLYHPPLNPRAWPRLAQQDAVQLPIPADLPQQGIIVGHGVHRDLRTPIHLAPADRLRHMYIIGQTGTGKSTLLQSAILQDIENGDGACFIDPHGEVIDWLLPRIPQHRARDIVLFDPSDPKALLGLNLLEWRSPDERDLLIQELIALFYKLFDPGHTGIIGPQFEHWLRSAALTVTEPTVRGTLLDIPRLFTDPSYQEAAVSRSHHPAVRDFWLGQMAKTSDFHKSEMLNYFTSKFGSFLGNAVMSEILSARTSAFDLRTLMDRRKILLVNLSKGRLGSLNAQLLGTLVVTKIQLAALSRADVAEDQRPPFYVYIDEFQNIVTDSFAAMLSEVRKYGVGLHLAHQYVDQLPENLKQAVLGNVGTLAAFRLGTTDARWLEPHFAPLTADDLTSLPTGQFHLRTLANGRPTAPFTVATSRRSTTAQPELAETIRGRVRQFVAATKNPAQASPVVSR